jgi:hypothetical protein
MGFHVYVWKHKELPRYVGRTSSEQRPYLHFNSRKNLVKHGYFNQYKDEMVLEFVLKDGSYIEACELEERLIRQYGFYHDGTGSLLNLTYGRKTETWSQVSRDNISGEKSKSKSLETRAKMSATRKALGAAGLHHMQNPEIAAKYKHPKSEETKQLMSQGQAECWADPDRSAKRRESLKAAWADPVKKAERLAKRNETLRNKT